MAQKKKKSPFDTEKKLALQFFRNNDLPKAFILYTRIHKKNPKDFDACFMLGVIMHKRKDTESALDLLQQAAHIKKKSAKVYFQLGSIYHDLHEHDKVIEALHTAIDIKPDYIEAYELITSTMQLAGLYRELIEVCRSAVTVMPDNAELYARMAGALEQISQLDEAKEAAENTLQIDRFHSRALFTLAKIERRRHDLPAARDRLQSLMGMSLQPVQMSAVAGEFGDVLDRLGEYEAAFKAFTHANNMMLRTVPPEAQQSRTLHNKIHAYQNFFQPEVVSNWSKPDDGQISPIFLVGFPRSGTTLTEQLLVASGKIYPSDEQTVIDQLIESISGLLGRTVYMPEGLVSLKDDELSLLRGHYWKLVENMCGELPQGKRFLDKLPLNIIELGFVYRLFPQANIIVILRDPRDCCLSCYMRQFVLNEAMINFTSVEATGKFYAETMGLWMHYRDNLPLKYLQLRYEDMVADLETAARALLSFLELEWNVDVLRYFEKVSERNVRTPSYSAIATPIYNRAVGRWKNYSERIAPMMDDLKPYVEAFAYDADD